MNTLRQITKSLSRLRQTILLIIMMCGVGEVMAIEQVDGVYQISSAADLKEFADIVNGTNGKTSNVKANAIVTKDITLSGEFPMIGVYSSKKYAGTFNGGGHSISGLQITIDGAKTGIGFFACTSGATIMDFKLSGNVIINNGTSVASH